MIRVDVEVTGRREKKLLDLARERGVSPQEIVRTCVDRELNQSEEPVRDLKKLYSRAAELIGSFEDVEGATDLSTEHDRYLYGS